MKNELKDKFPYKVPEGYFDEMSKVWADEAIKVGTQKFVKLNRKYIAIAAMFLLSFGGLVVYQTLYSNKFKSTTDFVSSNNSVDSTQEFSVEEYNQLLSTLLIDTQPKTKKEQTQVKKVEETKEDNQVKTSIENSTHQETKITTPQDTKTQEQKEADAILEYLKYYDVDIYETL